VLAARLKWDGNGDPLVPGNLQVWSDVLRQTKNSKIVHDWGKRSLKWRHPDQLAEAMFALSRLEIEGPAQIYLCLSELDYRRGPQQRLSNQTLMLLAENYSEFSDQYMLFSEFPELNDASIISFLRVTKILGKISDPALRGNAMGIFQSNVGLWQILARQRQIEGTKLNSSWQAAIQPFTTFSTGAQLLTAGRSSVEALVQAATGKKTFSQEQLIELLAGARQTTPEGQRIHKETADRIRAVLEDQRLVSIQTLFTLDDALRNPTEAAFNNKDLLVSLAGELREFEMPRPMFSSSERANWAVGVYNNRHTDFEMRTDIAKVIRSDASPKQREEARGQLATFLRDTLVGLNYAYYEPPRSQVLHNNPLFVRSHDFSGDSFQGVQKLWQSGQLFGIGSPAGGGAHLIGSLADLPYVLAAAEQDFIAPDHVQALIWQQFVPGLLSNAIVPRWWTVSRNELHAVALYQRAGEDLLRASSTDAGLRDEVLGILADRMVPERLAGLEQSICAGKTNEVLDGIMPGDIFFLASEFRQRFPEKLIHVSNAGRELEALSLQDPDEVNWRRLSQDFGVVHPIFAQTYARELFNVKPFPALGGTYNRLMGECWDSGNLYWARLADEMGYAPVVLNRIVPELTRRMVERIFASDLEDWRAVLLALRETGEEFQRGEISLGAEVAGGVNHEP
jgi:hypothetical protein